VSRGYYGEGDWDNPAIHLAQSWLDRAIKSKRGQAFLRELIAALDAMPDKRLVRGNFTCADGLCTLGAVGQSRGVDLAPLQRLAARIEDDPDDGEAIGELNDATAGAFGVARSLVAEIMWRNDDSGDDPAVRWKQMRHWAATQIRETAR